MQMEINFSDANSRVKLLMQLNELYFPPGHRRNRHVTFIDQRYPDERCRSQEVGGLDLRGNDLEGLLLRFLRSLRNP